MSESGGAGSVAATHTFAGPGPFTVTVCVRDGAGAQGCDSLVVGLVDHFMFYRIRQTAPRFERIGPVVLTDEFGTGGYKVNTPRWLGLPADKNDEGVFDPEVHLAEYPLQPTQGFDRLRNVRIVNQCNDMLLEVRRPHSLLVPTSKGLEGPVAAPDDEAHHLDHYLCYRASAQKRAADGSPLPAFPKGIQVEVRDQFAARRYDLRRVTALCNPVEKTGEPRVLTGPDAGAPIALEPSAIKNPEAHLVCYRARLAKTRVPQLGCGPAAESGERIVPKQRGYDRRKGVYVANQLGEGRLDTLKEFELCIPSKVTLR